MRICFFKILQALLANDTVPAAAAVAAQSQFKKRILFVNIYIFLVESPTSSLIESNDQEFTALLPSPLLPPPTTTMSILPSPEQATSVEQKSKLLYLINSS
jgi:hypothetical protein